MTAQSMVVPSEAQARWADCELGVLIHYDIEVFEPEYAFRERWGYTPDPSVFCPSQLNTDQWLATAKAAGARYAILVAKHCTGFSLWPTTAHRYSVASSPWRRGQGDVVADFIASCRTHDLLPGLYYSSSCNAFMDVDNPGLVRSGDPQKQVAYNDVVMTQLTELWSNYGDVFEIWFDGGALPPERGGPDVASLLARLQPRAVVFQGPSAHPSLLRWVGNERGLAPYPCWSTTNLLTAEGGEQERRDLAGHPDGRRWAPAETDMPNRDQRQAYLGGWFWRAGEDHTLYSLDHLMECYLTSVGRNSNMLLGMVVDDRGLVPDADVRRFSEFGAAVAALETRVVDSVAGTGDRLQLTFPGPTMIDHVVLMEDIRLGERVLKFVVEAETDGGWRQVAEGSCIGHKCILAIPPISCTRLQWRCLAAKAAPHIRKFAALAAPTGGPSG